MSKQKLIFFGGTFDPPHVEHVAQLKAAMIETGAKKAIVMPTFIPPHKTVFYGASAQDRFEMCRIAFGDIENVEISSFEIDAKERSYSYKTIKWLKGRYPDHEILFLMGTDMLSSFHTWKNPTSILENATPLLCERSGEEAKEITLENFERRFGEKAYCLKYVGKELSSTEIKFSLMLGLSVDDKLKSGVNEYIASHLLYDGDKFFDYVKHNEKPSRKEHTLGVMLMAIDMAKQTGADVNKALVAALLHDCAKNMSESDYPEGIVPFGVPNAVAHQYVGAFVANKQLGIDDEEVLNAIKFHTTGRACMTLLEKIVFTADMIERGRDFDGVEELRKIAACDFEQGFKASLKRSAEFVKSSGKPMCELTDEACKYYLD